VGLSFVFRISKVVFYLFRYFIFLIVVKKYAALPMFLCHSSVFVGMVFCHASLLLMVVSYVVYKRPEGVKNLSSYRSRLPVLLYST